MASRRYGCSSRGFWAVGVFRPKTEVNVGSLWRTAEVMGAAYLFVIAGRYKRQSSDVYNSTRRLPLFTFDTIEAARAHLPHACPLIGVELDDRATMLQDFDHPPSAAYLLGAEDDGLPPAVRDACHRLVKLPGGRSVNLSVAGSIVCYDRAVRGP